MRAVLRDRAFVEVDPLLKGYIEKELTYSVPIKIGAYETRYVKLFDFKRVNDRTLSIPIGRLDLIPSTHDITDKRIYNMVDFHINPDLVLRDSQQHVYDTVTDNCVINAGCGEGKTITALALVEKLAQKTIIILHTKKLLDQWVEEIRNILQIEPGIIGGGDFNIDAGIVVAMKQTLDKKADATLYSEFGTVISDECLDYDTKIETKEKGLVRIGTIVNKKLPYQVNSWNGKTFEWKHITNWFRNVETDYMIKFTFNNRTTLKCTLNHNIYDMYGNKQLAEYFMEDDYILSDNIVNTSKYIKENLDILLGCIIGDGNIDSRSNNIRINIGHGLEQTEYIKYKYNILKNICGVGIKENIHKAHGNFKETKTNTFSTLQFVDNNKWKEGLYKNKTGLKNKITKEICDLLTKESWSLIYMDDGSIDKGKGFIKFHIYMDTEYQELLSESLVNLFNIRPAIHIRKNVGYFIYLGVKDSKSFIEQIEHLIHPCLDYKKGKWITDKEFNPIDEIKGFENYTLVQIKDIDFEKPKNNYRYNITVEDNHNYTVSGKLVANCHHLPAKTFNNIIDKFRARYKIGLTATLRRKDQKHFLITNYISDNVVKMNSGHTMTPEVIALKTDIMLPGATSWQGRVTKLMDNMDYVSLLLNIVEDQASIGHKILCIGSRVELLKQLHKLTDRSKLILGGMDDTKEVIKSVYDNETNVIYGSTQVMSEGISINPLSCLIFATPFSSDIVIEQTVGRIIRLYEGKLNPVIFDIILKGQTGANQWRERRKYYSSKGYKITEIVL